MNPNREREREVKSRYEMKWSKRNIFIYFKKHTHTINYFFCCCFLLVLLHSQKTLINQSQKRIRYAVIQMHTRTIFFWSKVWMMMMMVDSNEFAFCLFSFGYFFFDDGDEGGERNFSKSFFLPIKSLYYLESFSFLFD